MGLLLILFIMVVAIVLHELGHYLAARRYGVIATEFNIGMGPKLCGIHRAGTDWNIRILPIGGSCIYGDVNDVTLQSLPVLQRMFICFAGPGMNLILAFLGYLVWKSCMGQISLTTIPEFFKTVVELFPQLMEGLLSVFDPARETLSETGDWFMLNLAQTDTRSAIALLGALFYAMNISLFMFNILPIPALDGGQIFLAIPELWGKPIPERVRVALNGTFFILLMGVSVFYLIQDTLLSVIHSIARW